MPDLFETANDPQAFYAALGVRSPAAPEPANRSIFELAEDPQAFYDTMGVHRARATDAVTVAPSDDTPGARLRRRMEELREVPMTDAEFGQGVLFRVPFAGAVASTQQALNVRAAALRIRDGSISERDYDTVARHLVDNERAGQRGTFGNIANVVSYLPGFATEFVATGGAFSAGRTVATSAATRIAGQAANRTAVSVATRVASNLAGVAAQTLAMPQRVAETAAQRAMPDFSDDGQGINIAERENMFGGTSVAAHIPAAFLDTMIEVGSEYAGGLIPGYGRVRAAARSRLGYNLPAMAPFRRFGAMTRRLGIPYHGIGGEIFEERVGEVLRGLFTLTEDYGTVGDILSGRMGEAGEQLFTEAVAFSAIPFAYAAATRSFRRGGRSQGQAEQQALRVTQAMMAEREANPGMTVEEGRAFAAENFDGPERAFAEHLAGLFVVPAEQTAGPFSGLDTGGGMPSQPGLTATPMPEGMPPPDVMGQVPALTAVQDGALPEIQPQDAPMPSAPSVQEARTPSQASTGGVLSTEVVPDAPAGQPAAPAAPPAEVVQRTYEQDLVKTARAMLGESEKWNPGWEAIERRLLNDPDGKRQIQELRAKHPEAPELPEDELGKLVSTNPKLQALLERSVGEIRRNEPGTVTMKDFEAAGGFRGKEAHVFYEHLINRRTFEDIAQNDYGIERQAIVGYKDKPGPWLRAIKKAGLDPAATKVLTDRIDAQNKMVLKVQSGAVAVEVAPPPDTTTRKAASRKEQAMAANEVSRESLIEQYEKESERAKPNQAKLGKLAREIEALEASYRRIAAREGTAESVDSEEPDILYSEPGGATAPGTPGATTGQYGPAELNARMAYDFQTRSYLSSLIPGSATAKAAALLRAETILTGPKAALDPLVRLEEHAHIFSVQYKFKANPFLMDPELAEGYRQFFDPQAPLSHRTILEGFAQWFVRRSTNQLGGLSKEQRAAATHAEKWLQGTGFGKKADGLRAMFVDWLSQDPTRKAGGYLSGTAEQVSAPLTFREQAMEWWESLRNSYQDNIDTHLGSLERIANELVKAKLSPQLAEQARRVFAQTHHKGSSWAEFWSVQGAHTIINGKLTSIGQPHSALIEGAKEAWLADLRAKPGIYGKIVGTFKKHHVVTPLDVWLMGNHLINEEARGKAQIHNAREAFLDIVEALGNPDLTPDQRKDLIHNRKIAYRAFQEARADGEVRMNLVSPEMLADFKAAMAEMSKDTEFAGWAAQRVGTYTGIMNSMLRANAAPEVHRLTPEMVDYLEQRYPDYVPTTRIREDEDWKETPRSLAPGRGEHMRKFYHRRKGSGEQLLSPLQSLRQQTIFRAAQFNEQLRRNAIGELLAFLEENGFGDYAIRLKTVEEPKGQPSKNTVDAIREMDEDAAELIESQAGAYGKSELWPKDGKPLWHWYGPGGELMNWRVGDRALYNLITDRQGDDNSLVVALRGIRNVSILGLKPIAAATTLVRRGATTWNLGYSVIRNTLMPTRDFKEFVANTIDIASAARMPEMWKRVYQYEGAVLLGNQPKDMAYKWFIDNLGGELRMLDVGHEPLELTSNAALWTKTKAKARQLLRFTGAGELAPRFLEAMNKAKQLGWTEERLAEEKRKADEAHAKGLPYVDPVPVEVAREIMEAAAEVTVQFGRQGVVTQEVNKIIPFFGPAVAGLSKSIRNWRVNPKGAMIAMGGMLALKALHWLIFHDEDWYKELAPSDRFNNIVVPLPGLDGVYRLPGPRELDVPVGGFMLSVFDAAAGQNPDFPGLLAQSLNATVPPGISESAVALTEGRPGRAVGRLIPTFFFGSLGSVGYDLHGNEGFGGRPIVPRREQGLPESVNILERQAPYAAQQLLGGRFPTDTSGGNLLRAAGLVPITQVRNNRRSIDEVYSRVHSLSEQRQLARRRGERFTREREYNILNVAQQQLTRLSLLMRGQVNTGQGIRNIDPPSEEDITRYRVNQLRIARRALDRADQ